MKNCLNCGTVDVDDATVCQVCHRPFAGHAGAYDLSVSLPKRPDGGVWINTACVLAFFTLFFGIMGIASNESASSIALIIAGALLSLTITFWAVGTVLRALWFLPGDPSKS